MTTATQNERLKKYLHKNGEVTLLSAIMDLGILSLSSRICELKRQGVKIKTSRLTVKNRYGEECRVALYKLDGK